nr:putative germin-like protein 8-1 [Lolium perenne]
MASSFSFLVLAALLALVPWQAIASDPSPHQDFCVVDKKSAVFVNGFVCKNPKDVNADDFFKEANLDKPRVTNKVGSNVTLINVMQIADLNTLGISLARIDYATLGQNPPHTHTLAPLRSSQFFRVHCMLASSHLIRRTTSYPRCLTKEMCLYFPRGSSTFSSTPTLTSQLLQLLPLVARTQELSPLPMRCLDQSHQSQMMFLPRHFKWRRRRLTGFRLSFGRTTTTKSDFG